jgi:hypothetical protein
MALEPPTAWEIEAAWKDMEPAARRSLEAAKDQDAAAVLCWFMAELSEEHWFAGWLIDLEFYLWELLQKGPPDPALLGCVTEPDIAELKNLHERAGGWWQWSPGNECAMFVPTEIWIERFRDGTGRHYA